MDFNEEEAAKMLKALQIVIRTPMEEQQWDNFVKSQSSQLGGEHVIEAARIDIGD